MQREFEPIAEQRRRRGAPSKNCRARGPRRAMIALSVLGVTAIAVPVAPVIARGDTCDAQLVTVVILAQCESKESGPVIAQQQQQAVGGGGGGGAASSSSSSSSGSSGASGARQPRSATSTTPTLAEGMSPNPTAVRRLQGLLRGAGLNNVPLNSSYDTPTRAAVRRFQRKHSIPTDRRTTVGPKTWAMLEKVNRR